MNERLNDLFTEIDESDNGFVEAYSGLLDKIVSSCPEANVVPESQQWSRIAAVQQGNCTIYDPSELEGEDLPFDPEENAVQITYFWDRNEEQWDLAWVATWPHGDGQ